MRDCASRHLERGSINGRDVELHEVIQKRWHARHNKCMRGVGLLLKLTMVIQSGCSARLQRWANRTARCRNLQRCRPRRARKEAPLRQGGRMSLHALHHHRALRICNHLRRAKSRTRLQLERRCSCRICRRMAVSGGMPGGGVGVLPLPSSCVRRSVAGCRTLRDACCLHKRISRGWDLRWCGALCR